MSNSVEGSVPNRPTAIDVNDVDESNINRTLKNLEDTLDAERHRAEKCDDYFFGRHPNPYMPKEASTEYRKLAERAINNVMPLIISNKAQLLYVENFMSGGSTEPPPAWKAWQYNRMDSRQSALYRAVLRYGVAYTTLMPGDEYPIIKSYSPRNMVTVYEDPANDEWPVYALEVLDWFRNGERYYRLWDDSNVYSIRKRPGKAFELGEGTPHGSEHTPVVRWCYNLDLEGRYQGEIEPLMAEQDRLNQTSMDRLLVQTFGSWKLRTVSGMALPDDDQDAYQQKLRIAKDRLLISDDPDTKFGSLPETSLTGFIQATRTDNESIAAIAAVPPHYLSGELNNLGADAIQEARASLDANVTEIRHGLGEDVEQMMRGIAHLMGDSKGAVDYEAQVFWRDMQNRSLSSTADALGKMATMLNIPVEALWERLPGVTGMDVERWKIMKNEQQEEMMELMQQGMGGELNGNSGAANQIPSTSDSDTEQ